MSTTFYPELYSDDFPLGLLMTMLGRQYAGSMALSLETCGADRYISILLLLDKVEHPVNQQYLVEQMRSDKASMVRMVDYLCEKKLIRRMVNAANRREYFLELTAEGKRKIPSIKKKVFEMNDKVMEGISPVSRMNFLNVLKKIANNLDELPGRQVQLHFKLNSKTR